MCASVNVSVCARDFIFIVVLFLVFFIFMTVRKAFLCVVLFITVYITNKILYLNLIFYTYPKQCHTEFFAEFLNQFCESFMYFVLLLCPSSTQGFVWVGFIQLLVTSSVLSVSSPLVNVCSLLKISNLDSLFLFSSSFFSRYENFQRRMVQNPNFWKTWHASIKQCSLIKRRERNCEFILPCGRKQFFLISIVYGFYGTEK